MPRGRAKLTDKQERILVQCQLMGLTTADMIQISNRLRALDKEKEFKQDVIDVLSGFTFEEKDKRHFVIIDSKGLKFEVSIYTERSNHFRHGSTDYAKIKITKSSDKFKPKEIKAHKVSKFRDDEIVSACPNGNKWIYRIMREIKKGRIS